MGHHNAKNFDTQKVDRVMSPFRVFYVVNRGESVSGLVPHTSRSRGTSRVASVASPEVASPDGLNSP